ncbi:MAG: hypothetical protein ACEY3F_03905 [Wolbachia sp.]
MTIFYLSHHILFLISFQDRFLELTEKLVRLIIDEIENVGLSEIIKECEGEERIKIDEETLQKIFNKE